MGYSSTVIKLIYTRESCNCSLVRCSVFFKRHASTDLNFQTKKFNTSTFVIIKMLEILVKNMVNGGCLRGSIYFQGGDFAGV
jgi:hypothetical protein